MVAPKLRFKEFDGDWELDLLGNLVQIKSGYSPSKYELDKSGEMPFLKVEELNNCDKYQEYSRFYTERNSDAVPSKSVVFPKRGAAILNNKVRILRVDALLDSNLMALIPQHSLDAEYLYYLINKIELYKIADTSTIPQINNKHIEPYSIYLPSKEEQTKIASFLSAVDKKISQLTRKHQLLSQYKQGMMQKLFSQQIRFKADDGSEFEEWVDGKLGDITNIQGGFAFKSTDFGKGDTKVLRIGDIQKNIDLDRFEGITSSEIPDSRYLVYKDSIVMALSGATFGKLGKVKSGSAFINQRVATFTSKEKSINEFLYQVMLSQDFYNYIQSIPSASAQPNISNQDVINYKLNFPCLEEQTKIANFLSAIDQKIEVVAQQIEQAKTWKKGLLQQMFV